MLDIEIKYDLLQLLKNDLARKMHKYYLMRICNSRKASLYKNIYLDSIAEQIKDIEQEIIKNRYCRKLF